MQALGHYHNLKHDNYYFPFKLTTLKSFSFRLSIFNCPSLYDICLERNSSV